MKKNKKESLGDVLTTLPLLPDKTLPYPMENVRKGNKIEANRQEEAKSPDPWSYHRGWPYREGLSYKEDTLRSTLLKTDIGPKGYSL